MLLLFVHDDQAEIPERRENRGPRADGDLYEPVLHTAVFVFSFTRGKRRMKDRDTVAVTPFEDRHHLRRQSDFRHHDDDLFSVTQHLIDQTQKHTRFAAAGDSVKQRNTAARTVTRQQAVIRPFLFISQFDLSRSAQIHGQRFRRAVHICVVQFHNTALDKVRDHDIRHAGKIAKLFDACGTDVQ